jgi:hypothetical protein
MLRIIKPEHICGEWDRVRAGLVLLKERSVEDWLPEDVYMAIKAQNAALYVAEDAGGYRGFLILQILPMFHSQRLHVWCAYSATDTPMLRLFLGALKDIATQHGIKKITFNSPRDEWEVVVKRGGFKATYTTYQLEI